MILCSGVLFVGYGAHVTPRIFQENFIDVMVNIDRIDRASGIPLVNVMMWCGLCRSALITLGINCNSRSRHYQLCQSEIESG